MSQQNPQVIIACDPGPQQPGTIGIAIRTPSGYSTAPYFVQAEVWELLHKQHFDLCIVEFFATSGRISKHGLGTVEMVGAITAICATRRIPLVRQAPFQRKAFIARAKEIVSNTAVIHEVDALAHLLYWEYKNEPYL